MRPARSYPRAVRDARAGPPARRHRPLHRSGRSASADGADSAGGINHGDTAPLGGRGSRRAAPRRTPGPRETRKDTEPENPNDTTDCTDDTDRERRLTQRQQTRAEAAERKRAAEEARRPGSLDGRQAWGEHPLAGSEACKAVIVQPRASGKPQARRAALGYRVRPQHKPCKGGIASRHPAPSQRTSREPPRPWLPKSEVSGPAAIPSFAVRLKAALRTAARRRQPDDHVLCPPQAGPCHASDGTGQSP